MKRQFFDANHHKAKSDLRLRIDEKLTECFEASKKSLGYQVTFDFEVVFSEVFHSNGGFDVVIANPPYVRIQVLNRSAPDQVAYFKQRYASAGKGNYDLYVVFVERGLELLQPNGQFAYILPHKFFNAQYGQPLRALIKKGNHLRHVVHFGDQQIFPGATNYVCLLFLDKAGADSCRLVRVENLESWFATLQGTEGTIAASRVTDAEWHFAVGKGAGLFEKLQRMPVKLEKVTSRIFQGIKTSTDKLYIVEEVKRSKTRVRVFSRELDAEFDLESDLLHPLVKGGDSKRFVLTHTNRLIIFPYAETGRPSVGSSGESERPEQAPKIRV